MRVTGPGDPLGARSLRRRFGRGSEIAAGNVEGPLRTFFTGREHIVRIAWRYHPVLLRGQHQVDRRPRGPVSALVGGC